MSAVDFFKCGADIPGVQELQYSRFAYSVRPNFLESAPTLKGVETLLTSVQKDSLQDRVQPVPGNPHLTVVDKFFRVQAQKDAPQENALKLWSDLRLRCQKVGIGAGLGAAGLTLLALRGAPLFIEVALFVGIVGACCFAGWGFQRSHIAEKQIAVWRSPGEDFALRRKASLELSLDKISKQKCHYHLEQPSGTLLGVEILSIFAKNLKYFAEPLLAIKCDRPDQQHQWVADFLTANPLMIDFFKDNPHLLKEKGWEDVQKFQAQIVEVQTVLKNLQDLYVSQFSTKEKNARELQENIHRAFQAKAIAVCEELAIDSQKARLYQQRLFYALNQEFLAKVAGVIEQHRVKTVYFRSLVYHQARVLLEQASKGLLEHQPYAFEDVKLSIPNFQQELNPIVQGYPQNVIAKAKTLSQDEAYQKFVDELFKALSL